MLGNGLTTLLILQIIFILLTVKVLTQNVELSLGIDTEEEQQIIGNTQLNLDDAGNEPVYDTNLQLNEENAIIPMTLEEGKDRYNNTNEQENETKDRKPLLFKLKYREDLVKEEEPGFDLTSEEMKKFKIWKKGVIPYFIDVVSFNDKVVRDKIRNFLQMVNSATSIRFVELHTPPADDQQRWVFFMNRRGLLGCADHTVKNFTNQGVQQVVLGYDCFATKGELAEAVMSIVGVPAQHNAPNRDKFIKINVDNIMPDKRHLFEKLGDSEWLFHDLPYDLKSITHYDLNEYSANGHVTIEPKGSSKDFQPAKAFSRTDILKIKMLYNYITRNSKLHAPVCNKLFKPSNKLEQFKSADNYLEPRKKPSRYLGIAKAKGYDDENIQQANGGEGENQTENEEDKIHNETADGRNEDENVNEKKNDNLQNSSQKPFANKNKGTKNLIKTSLKGKNINIDPLSYLSDYDSEEIKKLKFKVPGKQKNDPLSLLSDYQTGDERARRRM